MAYLDDENDLLEDDILEDEDCEIVEDCYDDETPELDKCLDDASDEDERQECYDTHD